MGTEEETSGYASQARRASRLARRPRYRIGHLRPIILFRIQIVVKMHFPHATVYNGPGLRRYPSDEYNYQKRLKWPLKMLYVGRTISAYGPYFLKLGNFISISDTNSQESKNTSKWGRLKSQISMYWPYFPEDQNSIVLRHEVSGGG